MPSSAAASKALVKRILRVTRRHYRGADTQGEILERWLDRQIERKTITTRAEAMRGVPKWEAYRDAVKGLEMAMADLLNVTLDPTVGWGE